MPTRSQFETEAEWLEHVRLWFAGQALVGVALHDDAYHWSPEGIAVRAYRIADAMLAARKTEGE